MRIKSIELCGFKSFNDKTLVDLSLPITAVVGPNGCGKSNIVDALMWAMGEQRARQLRGKSMDDVIFNGSDTRGPAGMAEVSVTFENDGRVPVEYRDYSELTITRRLHRDGTSEYLLNRLPVRLRDITNLFLGTGVGTRAYSIIEQGRVGMIVSAKPEDRRHFIEEAAGITKYRRRKQAAERKMEATRQNLLRVNDVLEEIGKRLGLLRRQAQKAERYKRYKEEMRGIELRSASHRLLGLMAETKVAVAQRESLVKEREDADLKLQTGEVELERARMDVLERERVLNQQQEELYQLDNAIKLNESKCEYQTKEAETLKERSEQSKEEIERVQEQLYDAETRREEIAEKVATVGQERARLEDALTKRQNDFDNLRHELRGFESAIDSERSDYNRAERDIARAEADLSALEQRKADLDDRRTRHIEENEKVIERLTALSMSESELDEELKELRNGLERLMQRRDDATARLEDLKEISKKQEAELEVLRTELHRRKSRLTSLEEIHARYEGFGQGTKAIMQRQKDEGKNGVLGVVADMVEAPAHYERALEAVLGQRLGTVVVENEDIGVDAISYLKNESKGRGSFISRFGRGAESSSMLESAPLGVVWEQSGAKVATSSAASAPLRSDHYADIIARPGVHGPILGLVAYENDYRQVAETLLSDVVVVENLDQGLAVWDSVDYQTLVTLEGEILAPDGTVTGGSNDAEISGVLRQKREIKELKEIIVDIESQYDIVLNAHVNTKTESAALEQLLDEVTRDGHENDKEILTREKDLGQIQAENKDLAQRKKEMEEDAERMMQHLRDMQDRQDRIKDQIEQCERDWRLAKDILALLIIAKRNLSDQVDEASAALTESRIELAQSVTAHESSESTLKQLEEMVFDRRERIESLNESIREDIERATELEANVVERRGEIERGVTRRAELSELQNKGRGEYENEQARLAEAEQGLKGERKRVSELSVEIGKIEIKTSEFSLEAKHLEEQVWERYREVLKDAIFDFHLDPAVTDEEMERLDQLRQLISRMGEINLTAIDEFNELDERNQFLSEHRDDLENALDQLQKAIQKINRTSRSRFIETFEAVNRKFQEVFPRLFRGGRAKLLLTEAEDILEAGVEIIAQPPGKKLASMEVMSGGEKALTATSLIFAMFLVKPTPFCLLDEVDAPLDEANVIRFRDMVREMSSNSQFIIITHNRNTMEMCDRLYGVTMEEPGCSKVLTVNLNEAQKVAA